MDKSTVVLRTNFKGLLNELFKKLVVVLIVAAFCIAANKLKQYVEKKFSLTNSIFDGELLGTVSMILVYIVLAILLILLFIALGKMFALFYELKRVTTIDFAKERIVIQKYDFPFDKEIEEKKFNRIVGIEIEQKSIDRAVKCGSLYVEYLVQSKNDSKLRGFEVPFVQNPIMVKDKLLKFNQNF
jgi:hypothetical protein